MTSNENPTPVNSDAVDLEPFCGHTDILRPILMEPYSFGEHTYASDGSICVRVPRRPDVPNLEDRDVYKKYPDELAKAQSMASHVAKLFADLPADLSYGTPAWPELPPENRKTCDDCDGDGEGPGLFDDCEACDGRGYTSVDDDLSIEIGGMIFAARYVRMILALPAVIVSQPFNIKSPLLAFRFGASRDGGEGLVMMCQPFAVHMRNGQSYAEAAREATRRAYLDRVATLVAIGFLQQVDEHTFSVAQEWRD